MWPQALHADQQYQRRSGDEQRHQRGVGKMLDEAEQVMEKALLGDVDPEQLGHLVEDDDEAYPCLEAGQHRAGNEVGDETETQQRGQDQDRAGQRTQGGDRSDQFRRVAVRHRQPELGGGQDAQCGGGTDAEHAGQAEQRVDQHRHEGRVQADGDGQAGHGRIGHGLRQDDGRGHETGDDVDAQHARAGRNLCGGRVVAAHCISRRVRSLRPPARCPGRPSQSRPAGRLSTA